MSSLWFDPTETAWTTEHYKGKYQATSLQKFGVIRQYQTCLSNRTLQEQVSGHRVA